MTSQALAELSNSLVTAAIVVYALAMVAVAAEFAFGRSELPHRVLQPAGGTDLLVDEPPAPGVSGAGNGERLGRIALSLTVLAFGLHFGGVLARGFSAGRVPFGNMYEFSITSALAVTGIYLLLVRREGARWLAIIVVPAVLLALGLALAVFYTESDELLPVLESAWLVIHVLAAIVSAGAFTVGAALAVLYLLKARAERRQAASAAEAVPGWLGRLPSAARIDRLTYRVHAFVFPLWTFAVIAGAIWAENAWGRYWGWDPKETWAFITWVIYAAYLHARVTAGWGGGRGAGIVLVGFGALWFNYIGVNIWFAGLHSYAGVG